MGSGRTTYKFKWGFITEESELDKKEQKSALSLQMATGIDFVGAFVTQRLAVPV
jgi:hypothetical protein